MKPITSWPVVAGLVVIALGWQRRRAARRRRSGRSAAPAAAQAERATAAARTALPRAPAERPPAAGTGGSLAGTDGGGDGGGAAAGGGGDGGGAAAGGSGGDSGAQGGAGGSAGSTYRPCPTDGTACKIMPFGDSITDGYNGDTPGGYRVELFRLAHAAGKNITFVGSGSNGPNTVGGVAFPHNHEGHSGWTIAPAGGRSGISTLVSTVMPQYKPDIVLLMIGTNDAIDNYDMPNAPKRLARVD